MTHKSFQFLNFIPSSGQLLTTYISTKVSVNSTRVNPINLPSSSYSIISLKTNIHLCDVMALSVMCKNVQDVNNQLSVCI